MSEESRRKYGLNGCEVFKKAMDTAYQYNIAESMESMSAEWRDGDLVVVFNCSESKEIIVVDPDGEVSRVWLDPATLARIA